MLAESMSQLDSLNLARSAEQAISGDFAQVITVTFAMVVGIYYFLHRAGIRMKVFAFALYTCGMLAYLGMMLTESAVGLGAQTRLRAIPRSAQALPTQLFLGLRSSWVGIIATTLLNLAYWVLWLGTGYLLFFWKKPHEIAPPD
ncbi:MAG: hypothetical protein ACREIF_15160 [Chthoniobacterales bacterium]